MYYYRWLYAFLTVTAASCGDLPITKPDSSPRADDIQTETDRCAVRGNAELESGDSAGGAVQGGDLGGSGVWTVRTAAGEQIDLTPEWMLCRVNGIVIADFGGPTMWAGRPATFRVTIWGEGPGNRPLVASRFYIPASWQDDRINPFSLTVIPPHLSVRVGNAGNQLANLRFEPFVEPPFVCDYRGGAASAMPQEPADIARGLRYEFWRCKRFDPVTGNWLIDPALVPGAFFFSMSAITLHIQNGSPGYPTEGTPQTTASAVASDVDFLRVAIWDLETGERVLFIDGFIVFGDFFARQLL